VGGRVKGEGLVAEAGGGASFLSNPFWGDFFGKGGDRFYWGLLGGDRGEWIGRGIRGRG